MNHVAVVDYFAIGLDPYNLNLFVWFSETLLPVFDLLEGRLIVTVMETSFEELKKGMISFVEWSQVNLKNETYYEKYWRDKT